MAKTRLACLEAFFAEQCDHFFTAAASEIDYSDWLDLGEKHGLLKQVKYDPAKHGEIEEVETGDMIYWPTPTGLKQ